MATPGHRRPPLVDIAAAQTVVHGLEGHVLLHCGPRIGRTDAVRPPDPASASASDHWGTLQPSYWSGGTQRQQG